MKTNKTEKSFDDLQLVVHDNAADFLNHFQFARTASAAINHNILQIAAAIASSNELYVPPYCYWTIEADEIIAGAAIYAEPDGLVVSNFPAKSLGALVEYLLKVELFPSRVIADPVVAEELVRCISRFTGTKMKASIGWQVGKLGVIDRPKASAPGRLRRASESDQDLVVSWGNDYEKEKSAFLDVAKFMSAKLAAGELYLWEDNVPTTIVTVSGRNEHGARVSSVYTPPRHRGYGYASSAVAAICDMLLTSGCGYVVLTWRIGDPAGRLYQRLGFRVIGTQQSYVRSE